MAGHSRPKDGVASARLCPAIHVFLAATPLRRGCPGQAHGCLARSMLEEAHGIDSTRFQLVTNHLDTKGTNAVRHQNIVFHGLLKHIPWSMLDRLVDQYNADWDGRVVKNRAHLIAMLYAQFCGGRRMRENE